MVLPNIWGHGQLFAFSGLDGATCPGDDLTGILCAGKPGIRFFTRVRRELVITNITGFVPQFEAVTGDTLLLNTPGGQCRILFAAAHLIIGSTPGAGIAVLTEGDHTHTRIGQAEIQDTGDGDCTALCKTGDRFAFAYGHTPEEAAQLAEAGMALSAEQILAQKLEPYNRFSLAADHPYAKLYAKCISVMKTQLHTPAGMFRRFWSTPDRLPHKNLWLWDSVFHAVGHRNLRPQLAEDLILAIFDAQADSGFIPHMASPQKTSAITQPPVIAWGAWKVYEKSQNKAFLREVFSRNKAFLLWCQANRRQSDAELYSWLTQNVRVCRCDECGMDNSPRFDRDTVLEAIDFSCFMANETRFMATIALALDDPTEAEFFQNWHTRIRDAINEKLWCPEDGFYYDYDIHNRQLHKIRTVASFLPLFAGVCTHEQAEQLVSHLQDPADFDAPLPIPSVSKSHPTYGTDMWRGAVWINYNYMIAGGLADYGFDALGDSIRDKTISLLNHYYQRKGTLFEFYDSENAFAPNEMNRKGPVFEPYDFTVRMQSIRDYGWSCTLCLDWLHNM